ncbi:MAG: cupredoxin domain-containing protein [Pseudomonadota bacterium]
MNTSKRRFCATLACLAVGSAWAAAKARVIKIEARKFAYSPATITVKAGEAVVLELHAIDFTHGFNLPEFKIRADLVPGKAVRVPLQPKEAGRFTFVCDNFCGDGHEEMNGALIVTP